MSGDTTNAPPDPDPSEPLPEEPIGNLGDDDFDFTVDDLAAHFEPPAESLPDPADDEDTPAEDADPAAAELPADAPADAPAEDSQISREESEPVDIQQPDPAATPAPETPAVVNLGGRDYLVSDLEGAVDWMQSLTPEQITLLNNPAAATAPGQQSAASSGSELDPNALPGEDEIVDPRLAAWTQKQFDATNARLEALQLEADRRAQQEAQVAEREFEATFIKVRDAAIEQFSLTDTEADLLIDTANRSQAVAFLASQNPTASPEQLLSAAFEMTYWQTPAFRERAVAAQAQAIAGNQAVDATIAARKANNSGLVGSGAVTPRQSKAAPQTPEEHEAAAISLVAEAMRNGNQ